MQTVSQSPFSFAEEVRMSNNILSPRGMDSAGHVRIFSSIAFVKYSESAIACAHNLSKKKTMMGMEVKKKKVAMRERERERERESTLIVLK